MILSKYKPKSGDRVEIIDIPWIGRAGTVCNKGWFLWRVYCDDVDARGSHIVKVFPSGMIPLTIERIPVSG